ncbi:MAG: glycosyltransferase [Rhodospirillaceae bacterium]|nr:glycosyltransferase [Rhodospirillaceae bacterium]
MRFMQIASFYPAYLASFHRGHPPAGDFAAQISALLADGFGGGHLIAPYMAGAGFAPLLVITNDMAAQSAWAMENGFPAPRTDADLRVLVARQIETFRPDALYVLDPIAFDARFLAALSYRPPLVMGWRAANIPAGTDWTGFDLMLSSDEGCRRRALELGARAVAAYRPGFPKALAARVADTAKAADIVFCGQVTVEHQARLRDMVRLMEGLRARPGFSAALHLGLPQNAALPPAVRDFDLGAVWGLAMYRAVRSGRIAPNFHIDLAATKNQNMRILETTGVGTFLLTEFDPHLAETFAPGREVETYANAAEMVEKAAWFLDHPREREEIAARGQARCFADHAMEVRAGQMAEIVRAHLTVSRPGPHRPTPTAATPPSPSGTSLGAGPLVDAAYGHLRANRINEAADSLNAAVQREPTNAVALHLLGRVAFLVGQPATAVEVLQAALGLKLPERLAWLCAADAATALVKLGKAGDALTLLRQAYALKPDDMLAARLAALLDRLNARDEAELVRARMVNANIPAPPLDAMIDLRAIDPSSPGAPPMPADTLDPARLYPDVVFGDGVQLVGADSLRIGRGSAIGDGSWLNVCIRDGQPRMVIGACVLVGRRAVLSSGTYLEIGSHTIFGPNVYVSSAEHEYRGNHLKPILMCGIVDHGRLVVEENCWLGMNAVVSGAITVGRGSVVGANAVLRESVPPFSVAVGSPARIVRMWNPETDAWEPAARETDRARIEAARARAPVPSRAELRARLDAAGGGQPLHPVVAGLGLHLR